MSTGKWHELTISSFPPDHLASQLDVTVEYTTSRAPPRSDHIRRFNRLHCIQPSSSSTRPCPSNPLDFWRHSQRIFRKLLHFLQPPSFNSGFLQWASVRDVGSCITTSRRRVPPRKHFRLRSPAPLDLKCVQLVWPLTLLLSWVKRMLHRSCKR